MKCDNCGSEVDEKDIYCGNCGHRIERSYETVNNQDDYIDVTPVNEPFEQNSNQFGGNNGQNNTSNGYNGGTNYSEQGQYNRNTMPPRYNAKMSNSSAIASLICGILSIIGVLSLITGIIGICMAKKAKQLIATGEYDGENFAQAGKICSTIGLIFGIIQVVVYGFMLIGTILQLVMTAQ